MMLLILVAIALAQLIHILILLGTTVLLRAIILLGETHLTMIIRLANAIAHLIIAASTILKTMSTIEPGAQGASVMADERMKDMSVVHSHLPMAMERRCIELLMNSIDLRTPKTMLMQRMVMI
jgi:hypothetical protein